MKILKLLLCWIIFTSVQIIHAQDKTRLEVEYSEYNIQTQNPYAEDAYSRAKLVWQDNISRFTSFYEEAKEADPDFNGYSFNVNVYKDFEKNEMYARAMGYKNFNYVILDSINIINWTIQDSVKYIKNMKSHLATTTFRDHEWEVWFTMEIPISDGPWKLSGLPGLILEAQSKNKCAGSRKFVAENINYTQNSTLNNPVHPFPDFDLINFDEYYQHILEEDSRMLRYVATQQPVIEDITSRTCYSTMETCNCYPE